MKNLILRCLSFVAAIAIICEASYAATSGTLFITGFVTSANDIVITPNANATTLNITAGETNKTVASVAETSNNLLGYRITMSSTNSSRLVNSADITRFTNYTVSYNGGAAVALTGTPQVVKNVSSLPGLTTNTSSVRVNVVAYPTAPAGTYSDTITIAIVAN